MGLKNGTKGGKLERFKKEIRAEEIQSYEKWGVG